MARFSEANQAGFANMRVGVLNGIAHLAGVAPSDEIQIAAERLADQVTAIRGVVNRIEAPGAPRRFCPARSKKYVCQNNCLHPDFVLP